MSDGEQSVGEWLLEHIEETGGPDRRPMMEMLVSANRHFNERDHGVVLYPDCHMLQVLLVQTAASILAQLDFSDLTGLDIASSGPAVVRERFWKDVGVTLTDRIFYGLETQVEFLYRFVVQECEHGQLFWKGPWVYGCNREMITTALARFQEFKTALIEHLKAEAREGRHPEEASDPWMFMFVSPHVHVIPDWSDHNELFLAMELD